MEEAVARPRSAVSLPEYDAPTRGNSFPIGLAPPGPLNRSQGGLVLIEVSVTRGAGWFVTGGYEHAQSATLSRGGCPRGARIAQQRSPLDFDRQAPQRSTGPTPDGPPC